MQTIYLDISNKGVIPCIQAKQNEVGRKFLAIITDNGIPYNITENSLLSVWYEGESGKGNYTEIGEKEAISVYKNKVTVELIEQMLSVPGDGIITVLINSTNGDQIGLWNIDYHVECVAGIESEKAEEYYTAFSQSAASLAQSADTIKAKQDRIDSIIKSKNATAAGLIYPLASAKVPSGFLLCDGAEYSRIEYAELFEAIGTIYGEGDGSTTFNVPNLSTRVPVGADGEKYELGATGGEAEHTLTVDEMPQHSHDIKTLHFSKGYPSVEQDEHRSIQLVNDWWYEDGTQPLPDGYVGYLAANGGNSPHNIMQPYTVVNYIISTGKEVELIVGGTGSGKHIIDRLCPAFTVSGPAVRCEPVAGYPLGIVAELPMDLVNFEKIHSKLTVSLRGKNLIPYPYTDSTKSENGIHFADNGDGSLVISGTATADAAFKLYSSAGFSVPVGATIAFGGVPGSTGSTYHYFVTGSNIQRTYGDHSKTLTITEGMVIKNISIRVKAGTQFQEPVVLWPQIELGDAPTAYEAFRGKDVALPFSEAVKGGTLDLETGIIIDPETYEEKKLFEPQTISALPGINTVHCNSGTVKVTGRADLVAIIDDLSAKVDTLTKTVAALLEG